MKKKIALKSKLEIYLGLDENKKGFKIYKPLNQKITIINNVVFDKYKFFKIDLIKITFNISTLFQFFKYFLIASKDNKNKESTTSMLIMAQQ